MVCARHVAGVALTAALAALMMTCSDETSPTDSPTPGDTLATPTVLTVYRSEYEQVGDLVCDIDHPDEGTVFYRIISGNDSNHFLLDSITGEITIGTRIDDSAGVATVHVLEVDIDGDTTHVVVADCYDYFIQEHPEYEVLDVHGEVFIDSSSAYMPYHNVWGRGDAVVDVHYRMATLVHPAMPDSTVFIWDCPTTAATFGGASVWCYLNVLWGNRDGLREDLDGFPFRISDVTGLTVDFAFEHLFGDEGYKIFLNHFLTDESTLEPFASNDGDFAFTFDQLGTWLPPYANDLGDTTLGGQTFARLHQYTQKNGRDYENRRVIVKDDGQWMAGTLDVLDQYLRFHDAGYLDTAQSIPNIQVGVEVTDGFGAVRVDRWDIGLAR